MSQEDNMGAGRPEDVEPAPQVDGGEHIADRVRGWLGDAVSIRLSELLLIVLFLGVLILGGLLIVDGFRTGFVFTKLVALVAAMLVIMYSARQQDVSIKALGLLVVATLIVSPIDAIRMWSAVRQTEVDWGEESFDHSVIAGLFGGSESLSERSVDLLSGLETLDSQLTIYAANDDIESRSQAEFLLSCAFEAAIAEEMYNALRGRDAIHWLTALMESADADSVMSHATDREAVEMEFELLKLLNLVSFPSGAHHLAVITPRGWHFLYVANSDRARAARAAYLEKVDRNSDNAISPFVQITHKNEDAIDEPEANSGYSRQVRNITLDQNAPVCWQLVQAARGGASRQAQALTDPFGAIPDEEERLHLPYTSWPEDSGRQITIRNISIGEQTSWVMVQLDSIEFGAPALYRIDAVAQPPNAEQGWQTDPWLRVVQPTYMGSDLVLAQNDDVAQSGGLGFDPDPPELRRVDSRAYVLAQGGTGELMLGVRAFGSPGSDVDITLTRLDMSPSFTGSDDWQ